MSATEISEDMYMQEQHVHVDDHIEDDAAGLDASDNDSLAALELYYRFGIEDIEAFERCSKGKHVNKTDRDFVREFFIEDATTALSILSDLKMAMSIQKAINEDQGILRDWEEREHMERSDHEFAISLDGVNHNAYRASSVPTRTATDHPPSTSAVPSFMAPVPGPCTPTKELDSGAPSAPSSNGASNECVICGDYTYRRGVQVPCGHHYDIKCLVDLVKAAMTDETLFPPRCCKQSIPFEQIKWFLDFSSRRLYEEKSVEFTTLLRLYCANKSCSHFLGPREQSGMVRSVSCIRCGVSTCASCAESAHPEFVPCKDDEAALEVIGLGRENGWQRCPDCRQLIELSVGCYHMTCRCKAEFCYLCTAKWKTCRCVQWDEGRLFTAAEERVERRNENIRHRIQEGAYAREINRVAEELRQNHDCEHRVFNYRRGAGRCDHCLHHLPIFLMSCQGCQLMLCNRCRRNRL